MCLLTQVWNWVMEPMLFATIGTSIVFAELPQGTIPKSLLVVCTGMQASWALLCCVLTLTRISVFLVACMHTGSASAKC